MLRTILNTFRKEDICFRRSKKCTNPQLSQCIQTDISYNPNVAIESNTIQSNKLCIDVKTNTDKSQNKEHTREGKINPFARKNNYQHDRGSCYNHRKYEDSSKKHNYDKYERKSHSKQRNGNSSSEENEHKRRKSIDYSDKYDRHSKYSYKSYVRDKKQSDSHYDKNSMKRSTQHTDDERYDFFVSIFKYYRGK